MKPKDRTAYIKSWLSKKIDVAETKAESDFFGLRDYSRMSLTVTNLVETGSKGFRGVVATALAGIEVLEGYNPLVSFYACNPRSIFEQAIWYVFTDKHIPCGLSDPLNVAKNVNVLDGAWVSGKRPEAAARAVVDYLTAVVNEKDQEQRRLLEDYFYYKLVNFSRKISRIMIESMPQGSSSRQEIATKLVEFSLLSPEFGATPQLIISSILRVIFANGSSVVCGGGESVFGTNTTSKKPADVWLEVNGLPTALFEVTLKKVDVKRLDDCIASNDTLNISHVPLTFVCRMPADVLSLQMMAGSAVRYKNRIFDFVDYECFVKSAFSLMTEAAAVSVFNQVKVFVGLVTTSIKAKNTWNEVLASVENGGSSV